ncbi:hypothetical protein AB0K15_41490 [Amycolatopsis sp. NPDC049253]|uniref:beta family protein n=1 Tax=Amycolatopsis sp. NPDC049253 TaxID=3155274 RepID=UPI00344A1A99
MVQPGEFSALVALRVKKGELAALEAVDQADHLSHVQPLLQFEESDTSPANQLDRVEAAVRKLRGLGRLVMIDASEVAGNAGFGGGPAGAPGELADRLAYPRDLLEDQEPIPFIPVVRADADERRVAVLGRLCDELGAGGALRVGGEVPSRDAMERLLEVLSVDAGELDLIVDLGYVPELPSGLVDRVGGIVRAAGGSGRFRSTSVVCGSIPGSLAQTEVWEAPRIEEQVWRALVGAGVEGLRFGDYGVVHPGASKGYPSKHLAVKYTCLDHWLYSRERIPAETGEAHPESRTARTFRAVCRNVVESGSFAGPEFSWGDREIRETAEGRGEGPGTKTKAVAVATSHHLAHLAAQAAA